MKKQILSILLALVMLVSMIPLEATAAGNPDFETEAKSASHDPGNPFEQEYWIIFTEGNRGGRMEASTISSPLPEKDLHFVWSHSVELNNRNGAARCNQYSLSDQDEWHLDRTYPRLTDYAIRVIASNLDVCDRNGNVLVKKCEYNDIDWNLIDRYKDLPKFKSDPNLNYTLFYQDLDDQTVEITGCTPGAKGDLLLPEKINGKSVTRIAEKAFDGKLGLTNTLFLDTAEIGNDAFSGCENIAEVDFSSATTIGDRAFQNCSQLAFVTFPLTLKEIGENAFQGCGSMQEVWYYDGIGADRREINIGDGNSDITDAYWRYKPFVPSVDGNGFTHSNKKETDGFYGITKHHLSLGLRRRIFAYCNTVPDLPLSSYELFDSYSQSDWRGACYGVSATMCLVYNRLLSLKELVPSVESVNCYAELPRPCRNPSFFEAIEYYHLSQTFIEPTRTLMSEDSSPVTPDDIDSFFQDLIHTLKQGDIVLFYYGKEIKDHIIHGHDILATSYIEFPDGSVDVRLYDLNSAYPGLGYLSSMHLIKDEQGRYTSFSLQEPHSNKIINLSNFALLYYVQPTDLFQVKPYGNITEPSSQNIESQTADPYSSADSDAAVYIRFPMDKSFTLTADTGEDLIYNSETGDFSGSMQVLNYDVSGFSEEMEWEITVPSYTSFHLTECDQGADIGLSGNRNMLCLSGNKIQQAEFNLSTSEMTVYHEPNATGAFQADFSHYDLCVEDLPVVVSIQGEATAPVTISMNTQTGQTTAQSDAPILNAEMYTLAGMTRVDRQDLSSAAETVTVNAIPSPEEIDRAAAALADEEIRQIGDVTLDSEYAVYSARMTYEDLSSVQKGFVTMLSVLEAAESKLVQLQKADPNRQAAAAVDQKISAIGTVTLNSEPAIQEARAAYERLTPEQKGFVEKLNVLKRAEERLFELKNPDPNRRAAVIVDQKIEAIGAVTLESETVIQCARYAYNMLTASQKQFVTKLNVLEAAEKRLRHLQNGIDVEFDDVDDDDWFSTPVYWAVKEKITNGMGNGKFMPKAPCQRGQVVTFLWRAEGEPEAADPVTNPFRDVREKDWFYTPVLWAIDHEITNGMAPGEFRPKESVKRREFVTFLWRAAGSPEPTTKLEDTPFLDVEDDTWYTKAVLWAYENHITDGKGKKETFAPKDICTRAEVVTFLYRAYNPVTE